MPTTVTLKNLASFAGATNLQLFLRQADGTLINTGGDAGVESSVGFFAWTVTESIPAEDVFARIYEGNTEDAATIVIDSILHSGQTEIGKEPMAGGGLTTDQANTLNSIAVALAGIAPVEPTGATETVMARLTRLEAQTSKLSGSPVTVNGNVKPGGQIVLKHGDNHTVALLNSISVPVDDVGGSLHTLMAAVGVNNLAVAAIRGSDPASRISGTVAALNYASNILTVTMEFTAAETAKGVVGPVYTYDVYRLDNPTRTYFSGKLTVTRDARP